MLSKTCYYDTQNIVYVFSKPCYSLSKLFSSILWYHLYLECDINARLNVMSIPFYSLLLRQWSLIWFGICYVSQVGLEYMTTPFPLHQGCWALGDYPPHLSNSASSPKCLWFSWNVMLKATLGYFSYYFGLILKRFCAKFYPGVMLYN